MGRKSRLAKENEPLQPFLPYKEPKEIPGTFAANMKWLETNSGNHVGRWVALNNGSLIASGASEEDIKSAIVDRLDKLNVMSILIGRDYIPIKNQS